MLKFCDMEVHLGLRDLLKFWEISANISETVQDRHIGPTLCLRKKQDTKLLPITSPNVNRFSKFFHW